MSEQTVWGLTTGSYSDYQVRALFTTRELAEQAVEAHNATDRYSWDGASVEAFTFYDYVPEQVTVWTYVVTIWEKGANKGKVAGEDLRSETDYPWKFHYDETPTRRPQVQFIRAPVHRGLGGRLVVRGTDEQAVKQAFSDNKARILAGVEGLT